MVPATMRAVEERNLPHRRFQFRLISQEGYRIQPGQAVLGLPHHSQVGWKIELYEAPFVGSRMAVPGFEDGIEEGEWDLLDELDWANPGFAWAWEMDPQLVTAVRARSTALSLRDWVRLTPPNPDPLPWTEEVLPYFAIEVGEGEGDLVADPNLGRPMWVRRLECPPILQPSGTTSGWWSHYASRLREELTRLTGREQTWRQETPVWLVRPGELDGRRIRDTDPLHLDEAQIWVSTGDYSPPDLELDPGQARFLAYCRGQKHLRPTPGPGIPVWVS